MCFDGLGDERALARQDPDCGFPVVLPQLGGTLDVGEQQCDDSRGQVGLVGRRQLLHQPAGGYRARPVGIERPLEHTLAPRPVRHDMSLRIGCRRPTGEQRRRGAREGVQVVDWSSRLGRTSAEPDEHDPPARAHDQVGERHATVHDGRVMTVEVVEGVGSLSEVVERGRHRYPARTARSERLFEVLAVDPVHHDHVGVVGEEVVPHGREARVGAPSARRAPRRARRRECRASAPVGPGGRRLAGGGGRGP